MHWKEIELFGQLVDSSARGSKEETTWTAKEIFSISWGYDPLKWIFMDPYLYKEITNKQSSGEAHDNPLQYSWLENHNAQRIWWAEVREVTQSWTWLKQLSMHACRDQRQLFVTESLQLLNEEWVRKIKSYYLKCHISNNCFW